MTDNQPDKRITTALETALGEDADTTEQHLNDFYVWMMSKGRVPARDKPLSESQARNYHSRIDRLYRALIARNNPTSLCALPPEHADRLIQWLDHDKIRKRNDDPYAETSKRKFSDALEKYFEWRHNCGTIDEGWSPKINFVDGDHESADKLNFKERWLIRQTATSYGSLPAYYETDPEERDRINGLVAQRLGIPKDDVTSSHWNHADTSTKVASLVAVTLETGIIPIEVGAARVNWYDQKRHVFRIPNEHAGKDRPTTTLPLTEDTGELLSQWIQERRHYEKYDDTNRLWLNRNGNPYNSKNLCYLLRRLCDEAGIDHEDRKIVWYSLRHNLGQTMEETEDLSEANDQLRHKYLETTKQHYGESAIESRRQTLEEINETARRTVEQPGFNPYATDSTTTTQHHSTQKKEATPNQGTTHIDTYIHDTKADRSELARKLLSDEL